METLERLKKQKQPVQLLEEQPLGQEPAGNQSDTSQPAPSLQSSQPETSWKPVRKQSLQNQLETSLKLVTPNQPTKHFMQKRVEMETSQTMA